jgi:hypothetical protein
VLNSGGQNTVHLYAKHYGGPERSADLPTSPVKWVKVKIENIHVTNGQIEIGVYSDANAYNWMTSTTSSCTGRADRFRPRAVRRTRIPPDCLFRMGAGQRKILYAPPSFFICIHR